MASMTLAATDALAIVVGAVYQHRVNEELKAEIKSLRGKIDGSRDSALMKRMEDMEKELTSLRRTRFVDEVKVPVPKVDAMGVSLVEASKRQTETKAEAETKAETKAEADLIDELFEEHGLTV